VLASRIVWMTSSVDSTTITQVGLLLAISSTCWKLWLSLRGNCGLSLSSSFLWSLPVISGPRLTAELTRLPKIALVLTLLSPASTQSRPSPSWLLLLSVLHSPVTLWLMLLKNSFTSGISMTKLTKRLAKMVILVGAIPTVPLCNGTGLLHTELPPPMPTSF